MLHKLLSGIVLLAYARQGHSRVMSEDVGYFSHQAFPRKERDTLKAVLFLKRAPTLMCLGVSSLENRAPLPRPSFLVAVQYFLQEPFSTSEQGPGKGKAGFWDRKRKKQT